MARGINKVILVCTLGRDIEIRHGGNGNPWGSVSAATNESWTDKQSGQKQERTEWHNLVFSGNSAEFMEKYSQKGSMIYVEGKLQTRKWQDQNGQDRYTTEIRVREVQILTGWRDDADQGGGNQNRGGQQQRPAQQGGQGGGNQGQSDNFNDFDDDIPF